MGSFRPAAGNQHLHWYCNFAGPPIETAPKSLLHSCRSELTRQGISLSLLLYFHTGLDSIFIQQLTSLSRRFVLPATLLRIVTSLSLDARRIVSEDPIRMVSCGLSNPGPFLLLDLAIERVGRALRMFPHIAVCEAAYYYAARQRYCVTLGRL